MSSALSEQARSGFDRFIRAAMRSAFALPGSECLITPAAAAFRDHEVVMLTVASYRFRVLLFIHFTRNDALRTHLAALGNVQPAAMHDAGFADAMMERGNLCCGALNRELSRFFPHLGMSTPCILHGNAMEHLQVLRPSALRHYRLEPAPGVGMDLTLAICAFAALDFDSEETPIASAAGGELEIL